MGGNVMERLLKRLYEETLTTYTEEDLYNGDIASEIIEELLYIIEQQKEEIKNLENQEESDIKEEYGE
jgi:hypothetical protein